MKIRKILLWLLAGPLLLAGGCGKEEAIIYGLSFTNQVYDNPAMPPEMHHTQEDYRKLADMGMNTVRFYLNYGLFEEDEEPGVYKESGFEWIDRNIEWAGQYGIRLILNMHYPQGGYQSGGGGSALWTEKENQERLIALWEALAQRYAGEKTILGYGILNEPIVPAQETYEQTVLQWKRLAQNIADAIRRADSKHCIYVERLQGVTGMEHADWTFDYRSSANFIDIEDDHYAYEFHYYNPMELTHQGIDWYDSRDGYYYPGAGSGRSTSPVWKHTQKLVEETIEADGDSVCTILIPDIPEVNLINIRAEAPIERIAVMEYNQEGTLLRTYFEGNDYTDNEEAAASGWNFQIKLGNSYRVKWQGGTLRADFFDGQYTQVWDRAAMEEELNYYLSIGRERGVPMYLGEAGTSAASLQSGLGGDIWLEDMLRLTQEKQLGVTIHCYHDAGFGLYTDEEESYPVTLNSKMHEILAR